MRHDVFLCKPTDKLERQHNITWAEQLHSFPNLMSMFLDCPISCCCLRALGILFPSYHIISCIYPCARAPFCSPGFVHTDILRLPSPFPHPLVLIDALFPSCHLLLRSRLRCVRVALCLLPALYWSARMPRPSCLLARLHAHICVPLPPPCCVDCCVVLMRPPPSFMWRGTCMCTQSQATR